MRLVWVVIPLVFLGIVGIQEAEARCAGPYPCTAPGAPPLAATYWNYSDMVMLGTVIEKSYGDEALSNYNNTNLSNPCNLQTTEKIPTITINDDIPFSERIETVDKITKQGIFLQDSELKAPFKIKLKINTMFKGNNTEKEIDIFGIERSNLYSGQFSYGYFINPELDEEVLLYLNYFDELDFGECVMSDVYKVLGTQGSVWGWNEDDYKPDIYPGDVKIPPMKEQLTMLKARYTIPGDHYSLEYDQLVCPLGKQLMYRIINPDGTPLCVKLTTVDKLEERGFAKRIDNFWEWKQDLRIQFE